MRRNRAGDVAGRNRRGASRRCGIATCALSSVSGADMLLAIAGRSGSARSSTALPAPASRAWRCSRRATGAGAVGSLEFSIAGIGGGLPVSSSVIAILKVPSTITTTLAPTSSERIFEVMVEGSWPSAAVLALTLGLSLAAALPRRVRPFRWPAAAAAAWAARRAAAMKLDVLTGSFAAAGISLIALSDAAMRSDGEDSRAGRPGARLERMIRRQFRRDRDARWRGMRLQDFADRARRRWRRRRTRPGAARHGIRAARRQNAPARRRDLAIRASAAA